jgi:hypothetical protein
MDVETGLQCFRNARTKSRVLDQEKRKSLCAGKAARVDESCRPEEKTSKVVAPSMGGISSVPSEIWLPQEVGSPNKSRTVLTFMFAAFR